MIKGWDNYQWQYFSRSVLAVELINPYRSLGTFIIYRKSSPLVSNNPIFLKLTSSTSGKSTDLVLSPLIDKK